MSPRLPTMAMSRLASGLGWQGDGGCSARATVGPRQPRSSAANGRIPVAILLGFISISSTGKEDPSPKLCLGVSYRWAGQPLATRDPRQSKGHATPEALIRRGIRSRDVYGES